MKFCYGFFFLLLPVLGFADTFVVTSNTNSGPGTLREAITSAKNNGSAVTDTIYFNIADTAQKGRTIVLKSELPELSSNLVVDGSSQAGSPFGVSNAKVCLNLGFFQSRFYFLTIKYVSNISIFGLFFFENYFSLNNPTVNAQAIHIRKSNNIVIGAPGKGNYFVGMNCLVRNYSYIVGDLYTDADSCRGITVQSNIAGLDENGNISNYYYNQYLSNITAGIDLENAKDVLIGGLNAGDGNYLRCGKVITSKAHFETGNGFFYIRGNHFGTDIHDDVSLNGSSTAMHCDISVGVSTAFHIIYGFDQQLDIRNNHVVGKVSVAGVNKDFKIQSNKVYSARMLLGESGNLNGAFYEALIGVRASQNKVMIGGETPAEGNDLFTKYTAGFDGTNGQFAIATDPFNVWPSAIEIKHNTIHCNTSEGSSMAAGSLPPYPYSYNTTYPWAIIDSTADGFVRGRSAKNNRIDIYQDDECRACEGKVFLGSAMADSLGKWTYSGSFTGVVVATATTVLGNTFGFTNPVVDVDSAKIQQPSCHSNSGFIKGVKIIGGDNCEWRYSTVNYFPYSVFYSKNTDIQNLKPGYYWIMGKLGGTCYGYKRMFVLRDYTPRINSAYVSLTQPSCGQFTGSITGMYVDSADFARYEWRNQAGLVVGTQKDLRNVGAGSYRFYTIDAGGCIDSSKLYTLSNLSGPTLLTANMVIAHATCSRANGSITALAVQNGTGSASFLWQDTTGKTLSNTINLLNVPAGKYRLKFKDASACDTIVTPFYQVSNLGVISIDTTKKNTRMSGCNLASGAITNIVANGADSWQWKNVSTGNVAGNTPDLINVPSGNYQLSAANAFGCIATGSIMFIPQASLSPISITKVETGPANCSLANGFALPKLFSGDTALYAFKWTNATSNTLVSNNTQLQDVRGGTYNLQAIDTNGCFGTVYTTIIEQYNTPALDYSKLLVIPDTCNLGQGAVTGLSAAGGGGGYMWSWKMGSADLPDITGNLKSLKQGTYTAVVKDRFGCTIAAKPLQLGNIDYVPPAPRAEEQSVLRNTSAHIVVLNYAGGTYLLYNTMLPQNPLNISQGNMLVTPPVPNERTYYIGYKKGTCESSLTPVIIKTFDQSTIVLPNAFSPNNDGINDTWQMNIQGRMIINEWSVFDRYGQLVFTTKDAARGWDGTLKGHPVPPGTYYWIVLAADNLHPVKLSGSVTIFR